ncbi:MAG: hypothetical protein JSV68_15810 [Anaerolineaceae bacterium]|nr:MAG: hypothetical protein JSV68_15810 [Anaerolineaceae bacterium]
MTNQDQVGGWVNVNELAEVALGVVTTFFMIDPPVMLILLRPLLDKNLAVIRSRGFFDPSGGNNLLIPVLAPIQEKPAQFGEVDGTGG